MARLKNTDNAPRQNTAASGKNNSLIIMCVIICVILFIIVVSAVIMFSASSASKQVEKNQKRDVVVTPDNVEEILEQMKETNPDTSYTASMNVDWYFADSATPSDNSYVENAPENSRTVYFDILLVGTNEMVYTSPYIPVGSRLESIALQSDLKAGDYEAVCLYHLVDDDNQEVSTVSVAVTLHVLN